MFFERQDNAYLIPAANMLGISLYSITDSFLLLIQIYNKERMKTLLYKISLMTWMFIMIFIGHQLIINDYIASPYSSPYWFLGYIQAMNYLFHFLAGLGLLLMMLVRLSIFYKQTSKFMMLMFILAVIIVIVKGLADTYGIFYSLELVWDANSRSDNHPFLLISDRFLCANAIIEGIFSVAGTFGFFYELHYRSIRTSKFSFFKRVVLNHGGYRFIIISLSYVLQAIFCFYPVIYDKHTFITHTGLYLGSVTFALELHAFLKLSYVDAKQVVLSQAVDIEPCSTLNLKIKEQQV